MEIDLNADTTGIFFDIPLDFEGKSKEELQAYQKKARCLMANFQRHLDHPCKDKLSKDFFGKTFDFSNMSREELINGKGEVRELLKKITAQLVIVEKLERLSGQGESTKV